MTCRVIEVDAPNLILSGPDLRMSTAQRAVMEIYNPYRLTRNAIFVHADAVPSADEFSKPRMYTSGAGLYSPYEVRYPPQSNSGLELSGSPHTHDAYNFFMVDRASEIILKPALLYYHPLIEIDVLTGKPAMLFGFGLEGINSLTNNTNGALIPDSIIDGDNAETNDLPLFSSDMAWQMFWKMRVPIPSSTLNGHQVGATTGGSLLAGASEAGITNPQFSIHQGNGGLDLRNRESGGGAAGYDGADLRTGNIHTLIASYNPVTNKYKTSINGNTITEVSNSFGIVNTDADALKFTVGAAKRLVMGNRLVAMVYCLGFLPGTDITDEAPKFQAALDMMAEF